MSGVRKTGCLDSARPTQWVAKSLLRIQLADAHCHSMDEKADEFRMPPLERRTSTPLPLDLKVSPGVCSSLHLVTCWHQNLTHALRKMLSRARCDAQARLVSKRASDSDTCDGSAEHISSCASQWTGNRETHQSSIEKKSRPDNAQSNFQPWSQNQCCGGCCPTRSFSRDQCIQCTFRDSGIPSTATRSEITATFCGRCVTTRHA